MNNKSLYYIGMDIHKKNVNYCTKTLDGTIIDECYKPFPEKKGRKNSLKPISKKKVTQCKTI